LGAECVAFFLGGDGAESELFEFPVEDEDEFDEDLDDDDDSDGFLLFLR
jgi:hypothetical protein